MSSEFLKSWDRIEAAYEKDLLGQIGDFPPGVLEEKLSSREMRVLREQMEAEWGFLRPLLSLIKSLRSHGFDQLLHAHRSMLSLGLATTSDYESWMRGSTVSIDVSSQDGTLTASYYCSGSKRETIDISSAPMDLVLPLLKRLLEAR